MNLDEPSEDKPSNWPSTESYQWMAALPRAAWAWEFLRRNSSYRASYQQSTAASPRDDAVTAEAKPESPQTDIWPMVRLRKPGR